MTDCRSFINPLFGHKMAIIVDKYKKRRDIATACTDLLLEKGFRCITISEIAKTAGIGKGTVYDYFRNKEEIVFEIIRIFIEDHHRILQTRGDINTTTKQKVFYLFDFFLCEYEPYEKHLEVYKEYICVTLSTKIGAMHDFNRECSKFLKDILKNIIEEGIQKGEIKECARHLIDGIMKAERGYIVISWTEDRDLRNDFKDYINALFKLIEVE